MPLDVLAKRGQTQSGSIASGEKSVGHSCVCCKRDRKIPPTVICPQVRFNDHFIRGAPSGSIGAATKSGWITKWKFVDISLRATDLARDHDVAMVTLPPHTLHNLQRLDRSFFGPFESGYNRAMDGFMRKQAGRSLNIYDLPPRAWKRQ